MSEDADSAGTNDVENGAYRGAEKEERNGYTDKTGLQLASVVGVFSNDHSFCGNTRDEVSSADRKGNAKHEHAIRDNAVGSDTEEHERVVALEVGQVAGQTGCDLGNSCGLRHARGIKELCDGSEGGEALLAELFNQTQTKGGRRLVGGWLGS